MFIAVYVNTFGGIFEPYGLFPTEESARDWINEVGMKKPGTRQEPSLWSTFKVNEVK